MLSRHARRVWEASLHQLMVQPRHRCFNAQQHVRSYSALRARRSEQRLLQFDGRRSALDARPANTPRAHVRRRHERNWRSPASTRLPAHAAGGPPSRRQRARRRRNRNGDGDGDGNRGGERRAVRRARRALDVNHTIAAPRRSRGARALGRRHFHHRAIAGSKVGRKRRRIFPHARARAQLSASRVQRRLRRAATAATSARAPPLAVSSSSPLPSLAVVGWRACPARSFARLCLSNKLCFCRMWDPKDARYYCYVIVLALFNFALLCSSLTLSVDEQLRVFR